MRVVQGLHESYVGIQQGLPCNYFRARVHTIWLHGPSGDVVGIVGFTVKRS